MLYVIKTYCRLNGLQQWQRLSEERWIETHLPASEVLAAALGRLDPFQRQ